MLYFSTSLPASSRSSSVKMISLKGDSFSPSAGRAKLATQDRKQIRSAVGREMGELWLAKESYVWIKK